MVHKAANARERFETAAMALFQERGYAGTTVPEIAARAGLTERTFFRYFADKPEVLFWRAGELEASMGAAIGGAPAGAPPLDVLLAAFEATGGFFDATRTEVSTRHALVAAHPEFKARDMLKKQELTRAIHGALRARGVDEAEACIASEIGMTIWRVGMDRWSQDQEGALFFDHIHQAFDQLRTFACGPGE